MNTMYDAIERGARAIVDADVDTAVIEDCWQVLIDHRININGYHAKAEWFFERVIERVDELRGEWTTELAA